MKKRGRKKKRGEILTLQYKRFNKQFVGDVGFFFGNEDWKDKNDKATKTNRSHNKNYRKGWRSL